MSKPAEVVDFVRGVQDVDGHNRTQGLSDLQFSFGDQWPADEVNSRKLQKRPILTINETDASIRMVTNQIRQQRPRIKAHPIDSGADVKIADIITGLTRHVEVNSDAPNAYDTASEFMVRMGWGYWRLRNDFVREDSFDQDIFVDPIINPFGVYFDTNSTLPDGSDAEKCALTERIPLVAFRRQYPGAQTGGFVQSGTGDITADWLTKDDIRLAEFYYMERVASRLVKLSDGRAVWEDRVPTKELLKLAKLEIVGTRDSYKRVVKWCKVSALETLDEKVIPGRFIPVVPCYGAQLLVKGRLERFGMVRFARDPQQMVNFWQTCITETVALAPKAKWVMADGQDEGYEQEWQKANNSALPILHYKIKSNGGQPVGPPNRIQPEPPPEGAMMAAMGASQNLMRVLGIYDPAVRGGAQRKSDKTINAESQQTEISNFHFYDNLTRSIKHTGRIILNWIPEIFATPDRVQRIIGADGRAKLVTLNEKSAIGKVLNDVTVGTYDVEMETGPGYNSRRQEALATVTELMGTPLGEKIAQVADDVIVRMMDAPGMDVVADRLAAANPLANIDETSDVPPQAQMMIKGLQDRLNKAMQALQQAGIELKFGIEKEKVRQAGETQRTLMVQTTKAHDIENVTATRRHDIETRAVTSQNVEEIKGIVALLVKHIDTAQLEREIAARNEEQARQAATGEAPVTTP
jgi:hypothetical protein